MKWLCAIVTMVIGAGCSPVRLVEPKTALTERAADVVALTPSTVAPPEIIADGLAVSLEEAFGDDAGRHAYQSGWSLDLEEGRVTGGPDGRAVFWDAGARARASVRVAGRAQTALLVDGGGTLVVLGEKHDLVAIDTATAQERWRTKLPDKRCRGLALHDGGTWLGNPTDASCEAGNLAWRVHLKTGELALRLLYRPHVEVAQGTPDVVRSIAFDAELARAARLVVHGWDTVSGGCLVAHVPTGVSLEVYDVDSDRTRGALTHRVLEPAPDEDAHLFFARDGATLTAKSRRGTRTWSLETGALVTERAAPPAPKTVGVAYRSERGWHAIGVLAAARDADTAAWSRDGVVWLSAGGRANPFLALPKKRRFVDALAFDPAGTSLTIAHHITFEATVEAWDVHRATRRRALRVASPESRGVALVDHDRVMFESTSERALVFVDMPMGTAQRGDSHGRTFEGVSFTNDAKVMFASRYGTLHAWDRESGTSIDEIELVGADPQTWVAPNDAWLAYVSSKAPDEKDIKLWDIANRRLRRVVATRSGDVTAGAFSPDANFFAAAGEDGLVHIHRVPDGRRVASLDFGARHDTPTAVGFSRAHLWVATARGVVFRFAFAPGGSGDTSA